MLAYLAVVDHGTNNSINLPANLDFVGGDVANFLPVGDGAVDLGPQLGEGGIALLGRETVVLCVPLCVEGPAVGRARLRKGGSAGTLLAGLVVEGHGVGGARVVGGVAEQQEDKEREANEAGGPLVGEEGHHAVVVRLGRKGAVFGGDWHAGARVGIISYLGRWRQGKASHQHWRAAHERPGAANGPWPAGLPIWRRIFYTPYCEQLSKPRQQASSSAPACDAAAATRLPTPRRTPLRAAHRGGHLAVLERACVAGFRGPWRMWRSARLAGGI